jgi:cytochrome c
MKFAPTSSNLDKGMKMNNKFVAILAFSLTAAPALAADELKLAQDSGCLACHAVDKKLVGPSYKEVAAKYKGDPKAEAMLVKKVKEGGAGVWGQIPMPPNSPRVSDANIQTLVKWVLAQ